MITSFFNPVIVNVFRTMIFGGASLELEKILAEGAGERLEPYFACIMSNHVSQTIDRSFRAKPASIVVWEASLSGC